MLVTVSDMPVMYQRQMSKELPQGAQPPRQRRYARYLETDVDMPVMYQRQMCVGGPPRGYVHA